MAPLGFYCRLRPMRVVLLHDWLTGFRGGERVLQVFCEMFPDAPLYTLIHKKGSVPASIENRKIVTSYLNHIPGIHKHYRKFLPLFPHAASTLHITEQADLILSSSHCVIKGVTKPLGAKHISYVHSPMRYLYDQFDNYFGPEAPWYQRVGIKFFKNYLVNWDKVSNRNVDVMLGNSTFVQQRIQRFYGLDSDVVYPFVDLDDFLEVQKNPPHKEDYYLMVTAFAPNKRVDLAIKTFNGTQEKLKIIGGGQQEAELRAMASDNIEFLGNVSREEVVQNFAKAKALIFPGVEDFGITPLESLAAGTPVIAYRAGGVLETLTDKTAVFFDEASEESLLQSILACEEKSFLKEDLFNRAQKFSKAVFKQQIADVILNTVS